MNQNWIVENLNNAFSTWNGKLTELWGLVTTSPQTFKGGAVWGVMQSLHNAMIGIGYALIVLFFAISLFKNTANFHELKRPEAAVHYLIRFVAAKTLVGYGMDIMLNIFSICNGVVSDMAAGMGGISQAMVALPGEVQSAIENVGFLASIPLWLVTILGSLFITVLSFVMILTVYGRFFRLYMYTALAPLPLASFAGESTQSVGIYGQPSHHPRADSAAGCTVPYRRYIGLLWRPAVSQAGYVPGAFLRCRNGRSDLTYGSR